MNKIITTVIARVMKDQRERIIAVQSLFKKLCQTSLDTERDLTNFLRTENRFK